MRHELILLMKEYFNLKDKALCVTTIIPVIQLLNQQLRSSEE